MNAFSFVKRIGHWLLYYGFARHLPASAYPGGVVWRRIRRWASRPLFLSCGRNVNIEHGAVFSRHGVSIGSNSGIGINAFVGDGTSIGSNVMMGPEVLIYTCNHNTSCGDIPMIQQGYTPVAPVTVEDDVWIGARVIILPGVTIGSGSVLGAGSVIARNVPPGAVVVGNPARIVRNRYQSNASPQSSHADSASS
jgi:maltose O-acetyltransferase